MKDVDFYGKDTAPAYQDEPVGPTWGSGTNFLMLDEVNTRSIVARLAALEKRACECQAYGRQADAQSYRTALRRLAEKYLPS